MQERERELAKNAQVQQPHMSHIQVQQTAHAKFGGQTLNPLQLIDVVTKTAQIEQQRRLQEQQAAQAQAQAAAQAAQAAAAAQQAAALQQQVCFSRIKT